jgi:hypothetical protein
VENENKEMEKKYSKLIVENEVLKIRCETVENEKNKMESVWNEK